MAPGGGLRPEWLQELGGGSLGTARSVRTWYAAARRERVACGRETQKNGCGRGVTGAAQDGRGGSQ